MNSTSTFMTPTASGFLSDVVEQPKEQDLKVAVATVLGEGIAVLSAMISFVWTTRRMYKGNFAVFVHSDPNSLRLKFNRAELESNLTMDVTESGSALITDADTKRRYHMSMPREGREVAGDAEARTRAQV